MQVLVMYYSKTGHTKKLAAEIAAGVGEVEGVACLVKPVAMSQRTTS
jgi:NAD(P)H dehydrogenase (quinone)